MEASTRANHSGAATTNNLNGQRLGHRGVLPPGEAMETATCVPMCSISSFVASNLSEVAKLDDVLSFAMEYLWRVMCRFYNKCHRRAKHVDVDQSDVIELRHEYSKEFWRMAQKSKGNDKEWASADLFWCALHALMVVPRPPFFYD